MCAVFAEVLGVGRVGPDDDFFALGGHSLLAVRLADRLRQAGAGVAVRAVFAAPTPALLAAAADQLQEVVVPPNLIPAGAAVITPEMVPLVALDRAQLAAIVAGVEGGAANVADIYPLAPLQEGMFFHHLLAGPGGADVYLEPFVLGFASARRLAQFLAALQQVIDRHDIFRTAVAWQGLAEPVQVVWRQARLPVSEVVVADGPGDAGQRLLAAAGGWMDLGRAPLLRAVTAADPRTGRWLGLIQSHHLLMDHAGLEAVLAEVTALLAGDEARLPVPVPFRDFVAQARLGVPRDQHRAYFAGLLGDVSEPTAPYGLLDARGDGSGAVTARLPVDDVLAGRVRERARRAGTSAATLFHLAWARVLASLSGRDDVVFGTVLLGRMHATAAADQIFGPHMNTLPVRVRVRGGAAAAVQAMRAQLAALIVHEHAPLTLAQQASGVPAPAPLFTSLLNYRHSPRPAGRRPGEDDGPSLPGITMLFARDRSNYPLDVVVDDLGDGFVITVNAVAPADPEQVCALMATAVQNLAAALDDDPAAELPRIPVLDPAARAQLLTGWNDTARPVPAGTLPELFRARAASTPDATAVVCGPVVLSYAGLDARAGRLAGLLAARGAGPEQVVAVLMDRSADLVVALLAVLKTGAAYLPVDPGYPAERITFMLTNAVPVCVLTTAELTVTETPLPGPAARPAARASGIRDLHLRVDRRPEGSDGHP